MPTVYLYAGAALCAALALFFYRALILEKERRRHDRQTIKQLRAYLENRDRLSDPDVVDRVLLGQLRDDDGVSDRDAGSTHHGGISDPVE